jgi:hypothetical protein
VALALGWTMTEVRSHTMRDIRAMGEAMERRDKAIERERRRAAARKASAAMSRGR